MQPISGRRRLAEHRVKALSHAGARQAAAPAPAAAVVESREVGYYVSSYRATFTLRKPGLTARLGGSASGKASVEVTSPSEASQGWRHRRRSLQQSASGSQTYGLAGPGDLVVVSNKKSGAHWRQVRPVVGATVLPYDTLLTLAVCVGFCRDCTRTRYGRFRGRSLSPIWGSCVRLRMCICLQSCSDCANGMRALVQVLTSLPPLSCMIVSLTACNGFWDAVGASERSLLSSLKPA